MAQATSHAVLNNYDLPNKRSIILYSMFNCFVMGKNWVAWNNINFLDVIQVNKIVTVE